MITERNKPSEYSKVLLGLLSPSFREALCSDVAFRQETGIELDFHMSFGDNSAQFQRSVLVAKVREFLSDKEADFVVSDLTGEEYRLGIHEGGENRYLFLERGRSRIRLPQYLILSPDRQERELALGKIFAEIYMDDESKGIWRNIVERRALEDIEVEIFEEDLEASPVNVGVKTVLAIRSGEMKVSTVVPSQIKYYQRLVGRYGDSTGVEELAATSASGHIKSLFSWRTYDGFLFSLLMSSHSSIVSTIPVNQLDQNELIHAYKWVRDEGDLVSKIGAIEVGFSILDQEPEIESYIEDLVDQILQDDPEDPKSRFGLLSALVILVEDELARIGTLDHMPPFWRRLASFAQASLIEREIIGSKISVSGFVEWVRERRGPGFYCQTLLDLRHEPYWYPEYISATQLKNEFIKRVVSAGYNYQAQINSTELNNKLFGSEGEGILEELDDSLRPFFPGPLEGGFGDRQVPPPPMLELIDKQLKSGVQANNKFAALVNCAMIYKLEPTYAAQASKVIQDLKYQLNSDGDTEQLVNTIRGLAIVAAVTKSKELAGDVTILLRKFRLDHEDALSVEELLRIGMISAASTSDLWGWCEFVGDRVLELAYLQMPQEEMVRFRAFVRQLCDIVPELWVTCGRGEAALSANIR